MSKHTVSYTQADKLRKYTDLIPVELKSLCCFWNELPATIKNVLKSANGKKIVSDIIKLLDAFKIIVFLDCYDRPMYS